MEDIDELEVDERVLELADKLADDFNTVEAMSEYAAKVVLSNRRYYRRAALAELELSKLRGRLSKKRKRG